MTAKKRADFIDGRRLGERRLRLTDHDNFPITCSIFCRRMSGGERLDQIVVGAGLRRLDDEFAVAPPGQQDERHLARGGMTPHRPQQGEPSISGML